MNLAAAKRFLKRAKRYLIGANFMIPNISIPKFNIAKQKVSLSGTRFEFSCPNSTMNIPIGKYPSDINIYEQKDQNIGVTEYQNYRVLDFGWESKLGLLNKKIGGVSGHVIITRHVGSRLNESLFSRKSALREILYICEHALGNEPLPDSWLRPKSPEDINTTIVNNVEWMVYQSGLPTPYPRLYYRTIIGANLFLIVSFTLHDSVSHTKPKLKGPIKLKNQEIIDEFINSIEISLSPEAKRQQKMISDIPEKETG